MFDNIMQIAPPEAYERVVSPVIMPQMSLKLRKENSFREKKKPSGKKTKKQKTEMVDIPFEPLLGKLFDCTS